MPDRPEDPDPPADPNQPTVIADPAAREQTLVPGAGAAAEATVVGAAAPPPLAPPPAEGVSFGRYRLLTRLGAGGMGVVWKAWDPQLGRTVALKQILAAGDADAAMLERFRREARLAARLRHPGIVAVYDVGTMAGRDFLTMDFVEGRTLREALDEEAPAPADAPAQRARLRRFVGHLAEIGEAVAYAHDEGIVHRDLKPGNVLLDRADRAHVMDFGLSREIAAPADGSARLTMTGQVLGTPAYMSPEQAAGDDVRIGPRADVYALGVMLYEVLTGEVPFREGNAWQVAFARLDRDVPRPTTRNPAAPADLEAVCLRAAEREPAQRLAAREFAAELRRWLAGEPVRSRPRTARETAARWVAVRRALVGTVAAFLAVVVGVVGFGAWQRAAAEARSRAIQQMAAQAAEDFDQAWLRTRASPEVLRELVAAPRAALEKWIADEPAAGAAYAWRAKLRTISLEEDEQASADFDRACELSPDEAIVWYLRSAWRITQYGWFRHPQIAELGPRGVVLPPPRPEGEHGRTLREGALADLERMATARTPTPLADDRDVRTLRAALEVHRGCPQGPEPVFALLDGVQKPAAERLRGTARHWAGDYGAAVEHYTRALAELPNDREAWLLRGKAHYAAALACQASGADPRDDYRAAEGDFVEAGRCDVAGITPNLELGLARVGRAQAEGTRGGDPEPALRAAAECFSQCDSRSPQARAYRGNTLLTLAQVLVGKGQDPREVLTQAEADYAEAMRLNPRRTDLRINRAGVALTHGQAAAARGGDPREFFHRAEGVLTEVLESDPNAVLAWLNRGFARLQLGQAEAARGGDPREALRGAADDQAEVLKRAPQRADARRQRGRALWLLGEAQSARGDDPAVAWAGAEAEYRALAGNDPGAWESLGGLLESMKRWDEAIAAFEEWARHDARAAAAAAERIKEARRRREGK